MTSGTFRTIPISEIRVNRESRQRRKLERVDELAASINQLGLINPITVTPDLELVAGERRFEACKSLGWIEIPAQLTTDLDPLQLHLLELEENTKRVDLTWQDTNDAIAAYHNLRKQMDPEWNQTNTAEALGLSPSSVSKHIAVAQERAIDPDLSKVEKLSQAVSRVERKRERQRDSILTGLVPDRPKAARPISLVWGNFLEWEPPCQFNLLHCDFPYGVNVGDKVGQSGAAAAGTYADTPEVYFSLLSALCQRTEKLCAPSAHMIFWFSMKFFSETVAALSTAGWRVDPFPLIWHKSDNTGIIPDAQRGPRRTYETALFCSRGDRKIVHPVANSFACASTQEFHQAEKPLLLLEHFFKMVVDEHTVMLDPTAGSGMAIKAAEASGAALAIGIERDHEFYLRACNNLNVEPV